MILSKIQDPLNGSIAKIFRPLKIFNQFFRPLKFSRKNFRPLKKCLERVPGRKNDTPLKESNRPIAGPNWAPLWIFKVPKEKKTCSIGDEIESNILILTLTNSNDLRLRLVLSKVSSDSGKRLQKASHQVQFRLNCRYLYLITGIPSIHRPFVTTFLDTYLPV